MNDKVHFFVPTVHLEVLVGVPELPHEGAVLEADEKHLRVKE